jgi:hypothetical protein
MNEAGQVVGYSTWHGEDDDYYWGRNAWFYNGQATIDIGLAGGVYVDSGGQRSSRAIALTRAGKVIGSSSRFDGIDTWFDYFTAWFYDGASTREIGLMDSRHTAINGLRNSDVDQVNRAGQALGWSGSFDGANFLGRSTWLFDGANTVKVGLTGGEYTRLNGTEVSEGVQLNESGQAVGVSYRMSGVDTSLGIGAWLYDGATTIEIGLTDPEHVQANGYRSSRPYQLNEAGQVLGSSSRYGVGGAELGYTAWLYDGQTTIELGLTGTEHTRDDGYRSSGGDHLNESGHVIGSSTRYNGSTFFGRSAWLFDGSTTWAIGLAGPEHTRNDGYQSIAAWRLTDSGIVWGSSERFAGSRSLGNRHWLYDGTATVEIGLTGPEHTRNDGYRNSPAQRLNEAGHASGFANRYPFGTLFRGFSAWMYDGATTVEIGLEGSEYTSNDGSQRVLADRMNGVGQVTGYSARFNGRANEMGQDAWFYDPVLDETFALRLSTAANGYAFSQVNYLGEDGLVLGAYALFDSSNANLGNRAFYFTIADGLHDLGLLVDGGLLANGWESLATAVRGNDVGQIVGHGTLNSPGGSQMAYLLRPVPEPSSAALALVALLGLAVVWWRKTARA